MGRSGFRKTPKGFSLLELVVAIAFLAVGITVVLRAFSFSAQAAAVACDMVRASFLADAQLQNLELRERSGTIDKEPSQYLDQSGAFETEYRIEPVSDGGLYAVRLDVRWLRSRREKSIALTTYLR